MKVRCPKCGYIAEKLPPTQKCRVCSNYSDEWLTFDWEAYALHNQKVAMVNLIIIVALVLNIAVAIYLESTFPLQWIFSVLFIPAVISFIRCRRRLSRKSDYRGHKARDFNTWFTFFVGM